MTGTPLRYRCSLSTWIVLGMMVLPPLTLWLLGPAAIWTSTALAG
jgi:hypothetical protein